MSFTCCTCTPTKLAHTHSLTHTFTTTPTQKNSHTLSLSHTHIPIHPLSLGHCSFLHFLANSLFLSLSPSYNLTCCFSTLKKARIKNRARRNKTFTCQWRYIFIWKCQVSNFVFFAFLNSMAGLYVIESTLRSI